MTDSKQDLPEQQILENEPESTKVLNHEVIQYLTFDLANNTIGVPLEEVKEVIGVKSMTILPRTPEFVRGVINLRGQIIPVIDLRLKFSMSETQFTVDTCIVIFEVFQDDEPFFIGTLTDTVDDVIEVSTLNVSPAPKMGGAMDSKFIKGMYQIEDEFITLLNIEQLFSIDELMEGATTGIVSSNVA